MPPAKQEWVQVQLRLLAEVEAELRAIAEADGRSTANLLRLLVRRFLEQQRARAP